MGQIKILFKVKNGRLSFFLKKKEEKKMENIQKEKYKKGGHNSEGDGKPQL
jgi:hypothetical protein